MEDLGLNSPHSLGTTIVGMSYDGGVILGADPRTSTGMYVANRASDKITQLADSVYLCRSGSSILQAGMIVGGWDKYEGGQIYSVPLGGTPLRQPFAIGGSGSSYLYGFFDQAWKNGMTEEELKYAQLTLADYLRVSQRQLVIKSLSSLVVKAVSLAIARDGASGGVVRTVTINAEGVTKKFYAGNELPLWHEEITSLNSLLEILSSGT